MATPRSSALTGGPRVYDEPPRAALPPYVVFAGCESADVSGDDAPAEEHAVSLEVWSREGGLSRGAEDFRPRRAPARRDGARARRVSPRGPRLARDGGGPDPDAGYRRAAMRFRAVTEPTS